MYMLESLFSIFQGCFKGCEFVINCFDIIANIVDRMLKLFLIFINYMIIFFVKELTCMRSIKYAVFSISAKFPMSEGAKIFILTLAITISIWIFIDAIVPFFTIPPCHNVHILSFWFFLISVFTKVTSTNLLASFSSM